MKRHLLVAILLVVFGPACKSAGSRAPAGTPALPDPLGEYTGELRVIRHAGDKQTVKARPGERPSGTCDLAVRVRAVTFEKGTARFSLDTIGLAKVKGQAAQCKRAQPGLMLLVEGLTEVADGEAVRERVDAVLWTPESYLESKGITFELPAADGPPKVASREAFAGTTEQTLGRQVSVWPQVLLSVDPWYYDASGRIRQEGEIELDAVVGTDGRLHEPNVRTGLGSSHQRAVLGVLPLWRFEPARLKDEPVGARILLHPILRIF